MFGWPSPVPVYVRLEVGCFVAAVASASASAVSYEGGRSSSSSCARLGQSSVNVRLSSTGRAGKSKWVVFYIFPTAALQTKQSSRLTLTGIDGAWHRLVTCFAAD